MHGSKHRGRRSSYISRWVNGTAHAKAWAHGRQNHCGALLGAKEVSPVCNRVPIALLLRMLERRRRVIIEPTSEDVGQDEKTFRTPAGRHHLEVRPPSSQEPKGCFANR